MKAKTNPLGVLSVSFDTNQALSLSRRFIDVSTKFTALHRWPKAPKQVNYLRSLHRHEFHVKVTLRVTHSDRNVEFHMFKTDLDARIIGPMLKRMNSKQGSAASCEHMAEFIAAQLLDYGYKVVAVSVSEDGGDTGRLELQKL